MPQAETGFMRGVSSIRKFLLRMSAGAFCTFQITYCLTFIDQLRYAGLITAKHAILIAINIDFSKFHLERVIG